MGRTIYVILNENHYEDPDNVAAFSSLEEAKKFFRQFILDNYWHPGDEWRDEVHKDLDEAVEMCGFSDNLYGDYVTITEVQLLDSAAETRSVVYG